MFRRPLPVLVLVAFVASSLIGPVLAKEKAELPSDPAAYKDVIYAKLGSGAFVEDHDGRLMHFKAMFIGEWTLVDVYRLGDRPLKTDNRVFINHRDVSYAASDTPLGNTDIELPPFAISVTKDQSDIVYQVKRGEIIEVWGRAERYATYGKTGIQVVTWKVAKATP